MGLSLPLKATPPQFEDYPIHKTYDGPTHALNLKSSKARESRSQLRDAAKRKPDFAGKYIVATWGCGSSCAEIALIDAKTGNVYLAPFRSQSGIEHHIESSLLVVNPKASTLFDTYYYLWKNQHFEEIKVTR